MFNDIAYWNKDNLQRCLTNAKDVTEYAKQFELGHWCFCGLGREKVWYSLCARTNQMDDGITSPGKWHRSLNKLHIQYFIMLNHSWTEISSPRRSSRTFTFRVRPEQRQSLLAQFWHAISCMFTPQCVFVLISTIKNRSLSSWRTGTLHRRLHVLDTPKRSNCFVRTNVRQRKQQNHCSSVTRGRLLNQKWQSFDQTFDKEWRKMDTGMQRKYTLPRSNPNSELVCASKDNVRIGPVMDTKTTHLSGLHSIEVLIPSKQNFHNCFWSTHQQRNQSMRLSHAGFEAIRCWRNRSHFLHVKKNCHSQEKPCANPTKWPKKAGHNWHSNNPSERCTSKKRTTSHSYGRKVVVPYSGFAEIRSQSGAAFSEGTEYSSTRTSSSRKGWSSVLAQNNAKSVWSASQRTILEF